MYINVPGSPVVSFEGTTTTTWSIDIPVIVFVITSVTGTWVWKQKSENPRVCKTVGPGVGRQKDGKYDLVGGQSCHTNLLFQTIVPIP